MQKLRPYIIAVLLLLALVSANQYWQVVDVQQWPAVRWLYSSAPKTVVFVSESADRANLTSEQIAWLGSVDFRNACKAKGIAFYDIDPDQHDKNGHAPIELSPAIDRAKVKGLPRLILIGPRGGITDFAAPKNEAEARKRIGL